MAEAGTAVPVVLASASPRRRELLGRLGIAPDVRPADVDETPAPGEAATDLVLRLAAAKAEAVARDLADAARTLVVAADTEVELDGDVLGKPADDEAAAEMLRRLSGRSHRVVTGLAVRLGDRVATRAVGTEVRLRTVSPAEIDAYVATGEPRDKAGAYAVQGGAGAFVVGIDGSDSNVIGLPLADLVACAAEVGVTILPDGSVTVA